MKSFLFLLVSFPLWSNETCLDATLIEINEYPDYDIVYNVDFSNSSLSSEDIVCSTLVANNASDKWIYFDAPQNLLVITTNLFAELYKGPNCNNLTFVECLGPDGMISNKFIATQRYYIRLFGYSSQVGAVSVNIPPTPSYNTSCENAHILIEQVSLDHNFGGCLNDDPVDGQADCQYKIAGDIWYKFLANTPFYELSISGFLFREGQVQVFKEACNQLELIYCKELPNSTSYSIGKFYYPFEINEEYYIRFSSNIDDVLNNYPFSITLSETVGYPNNYCQGSTFVSNDGNQSACETFSEFNTSTDYSIELPSCWEIDQVYDSWYDFTAKSERYVLSTESGNLAVYSGNCDSLTLIGCGNEILLESLELEQNYLIRTVGSGEFCINPFAINASCFDAIDLEPQSSGQNINYSMINAGLFSQECNDSAVNDIWFTFTANSTSVVFDPENNSGPYTLALFQGSCDSLELISCYENAGYYSHRVDDIIIGEKYIFSYSSPSSNSINFKLASVPANEYFDAAKSITGDTCFIENMEYVESDTSSYQGEPYYFGEGLWYEFRPNQEVYKIRLSNSEESIFRIFKKGIDGKIESLANFPKPFYFDEYYERNVHFIAGNTYYIQVKSNSDRFKICLDGANPLVNYEPKRAQNLMIDSITNCAGFSFKDMVSGLWENEITNCMPDPNLSSLWYYFQTNKSSILIATTSILGAPFQIFEVDDLGNLELDCPVTEGRVQSFAGSFEGVVVRDLDPDKIYLIRFYVSDNISYDFFESSFSFCLRSPPTNPNDLFLDAIEVEVLLPYECQIPEYSFHSANNNPTNPNYFSLSCDPVRLPDNDVWFSFVATDTTLGFYFDPYAQGFSKIYYELYTWENNQLYCHQYESINPITHPTTLSTFNNLEIGVKYFLRFPQNKDPEILFDFHFCIYEHPSPPANNDLEGAITLFPSDNLTQCNSTGFLPFSGSTDNSVWHKFVATSTSHQLLIYSNQVWFDTNLFEENSSGELELLSTHELLQLLITLANQDYAEYEEYIDKYYVLENDEFHLSLHNYNSLEIGKEYYIQIGFAISNPDDIYLTSLDFFKHEYSTCLKTLPQNSISINAEQAQQLTLSPDSITLVASNATLVKADLSVYNDNNFCPKPSEISVAFYPESWFYFEATQTSATCFIENLAKPSVYIDQLLEKDEKLFDTYISIFRESPGGSLESLHCNEVISSSYLLDDLILGENYYVRINYNCLNYITDLHFNFGISSLVDLDGDGYYDDLDCDDSNPFIYPTQTEEPYNGLDDDCDATTLDDDLDQDGFLMGDDCDDNNPNINPATEDIPNNGIDEDCDGADLISSTHTLSNTTIKIYPNPANEHINIDISGSLNFETNLYNLNGKLTKSNRNNTKLKVTSFPTGTYILEIIDLKTGQTIIEKIIIGI